MALADMVLEDMASAGMVLGMLASADMVLGTQALGMALGTQALGRVLGMAQALALGTELGMEPPPALGRVLGMAQALVFDKVGSLPQIQQIQPPGRLRIQRQPTSRLQVSAKIF